MDLEEYKTRLEKINAEAIEAKKMLMVEYMNRSAKYKVGDIIQDHIGIIKIEKIRAIPSHFKILPDIIYRGIELKKDLTPKIRQNHTQCYESNVERKF